MPAHRIGVVIGGNGAESAAMGDFVMAFAYALLTGNTAAETRLRSRLASAPAPLTETRRGIAADRARRAARPQVTPLPMTANTGRFVDPTFGSLVVSVRDGRLYVANGVLESVAEVYDGAPYKWRVELTPGSGSVLEFQVEDGRVTGVSFEGPRLRRVA